MIYKILNYIFGYDYLVWVNTADSGIARIHVGKDGKVYYWRYKSTKVLDEIRDRSLYVWLTCKPEKYLGSEK